MIEQTKQIVEDRYTVANGYAHDAKVRYQLQFGRLGCDGVFYAARFCLFFLRGVLNSKFEIEISN